MKRVGAKLVLLVLAGCGSENADGVAPDAGGATGGWSADAGKQATQDAAEDAADATIMDALEDASPDTPSTPAGDAQTQAGSPDAETPPACAAMAAAKCEVFLRCAPSLFAQTYPSTAFCQAVTAWECAQAFARRGVAWSIEDVTTCATQAASLTCEKWLAGGLDATCAPGPGRLSEGSGCDANFSDQCAEGLFCALPDAAGCGTCERFLDIGADCTERKWGCPPGSVCSVALSGKGSCKALASPGMPCNASTRCQQSNFCPASARSCVPTVQCAQTCMVGAVTQGQDCRSSPCDARLGLFCHPDTRTCQPDTECSRDARPGGCAGSGRDLGDACLMDEVCAGPATCQAGRCALPPRAQSCDG